MITHLRFIPSAFAAMIVTAALFSFMHFLVQYEARPGGERSNTFEFQFRQVIPKTEPEPPPPIDEPEYREPDPPPPKPSDPATQSADPARPPVNITLTSLPGTGGPAVALCKVGTCMHREGAGRAGQLVPVVRIQPPYPRRAALGGIEGWVRVSFVVTETGAVVDPRIEESMPARVFDQTVLSTILKWKFRPQTTADGTPVRVRAVQTLEFRL